MKIEFQQKYKGFTKFEVYSFLNKISNESKKEETTSEPVKFSVIYKMLIYLFLLDEQKEIICEAHINS